MQNYKVYEIMNIYGGVEYVGMSKNPEFRFIQHTKHKPSTTSVARGKFLGRQDLILNIVGEFETLKEARDFEEALQLDYGFEPDRVVKKRNMSANNILKNLSEEELKDHQSQMALKRWNKNNLNN